MIFKALGSFALMDSSVLLSYYWALFDNKAD